MFPDLNSSSHEISSKCNAFVQTKEERNERLGEKPEYLDPVNPTFEVPEMRDECEVVKGTVPSPHLTVIANHPSPAATSSVDHYTAVDGDMELISRQKIPLSTKITDKMTLGDNSDAAASLVRVKSRCTSIRFSALARGETPFDIPTNDKEAGPDCDYYTRWGLPRGGLRGGGEGALAASGLRGGDGSWGAAGAGGAGGSWAQGQPPAQGTQWSGGANRQAGAPAPGGNNNNNSATSAQGSASSGGSGPSSQTPAAAPPAAQPPTSQAATSQPPPTSQSQPTTSSQPVTSAANNTNNNTGGSGNASAQSANGAGNNGQPANGSGGSGWNGSGNKGSSSQPGATSTKQQMEQLNSMREALFSQDGWGGQNVNQDSNWDIPGSPEPGSKDAPTPQQMPMWKPNINNVVAGTDLWEANLRNGGALPAPTQQQTQKTPWTHTPANNIGGTWGEEDDMDTSNMWTGVPATGSGGGSGTGGQQWGGEGGGNPGWTGNKKESWGGPGWGAQGDLRPPDGRQMMPDPRDHLRPQPQQVNIDHRGMSGNSEVLQARGITGRLNGVAGEAIWQHHGLGSGPHGKLTQWGANNAKPSGWDEPSPPTQRRPMPNYDDGTSLWGSQGGVRQPTLPTGSKVSHWKDLPAGGQGVGRALSGGGRKDGGSWTHPQRNGWDGDGAPAGWSDDKMPWLEPSVAWQQPQKHNKPWDAEMDQPPWIHPPKQPPTKLLSKEAIWNSRQFRLLTDMQYKKEDVENALRMSGMNVEDALELLGREAGWRGARGGHGELEAEAHGLGAPFGGAQGLCLPSYQGPPPTRPAPAQPPQQPSTSQLRMLVQQIQMAVQAGYLNHQILSQPLAPQTLLLLNQLLNQIKLLQGLQGVVYQSQSSSVKPPGHQVLQTQVKITQTKQHIQNLQNQIANQQAVWIKQQQQQLPPQQQSQQQQPQQDLFRSNPVHDPIAALQSSFPDLSIKDPQMGGTSQQSRLNQWKLPLLDKDSELTGGSEFSRAPGPAKGGSSSPNMPLTLGGPPSDGTWSNRAGEATAWPAQPQAQDPVQDDASKDTWPTSSQQQAFSDLVPEFEPGKPWKGNVPKTAEEDPSITPGQCVRSPLAVPSLGMKESHMLASNGSSGGGKTSPTSSTSLDIMPIPSLGPSPWSFTPPTATAQSASGIGLGSKLGGTKWGESSASAGELWGNGKASRPPPGLPSKPAAAAVSATPTSTNGWAAPRWSQATQPPQSSWNPSTWLLLRNLTPQIDGSTLKTLCLQHGPLMSFHLYLSNGIALARYTSREEAQKAQGALNNCVLGNTTIFAENPSDNDVGPLVQHLSGHGSGGGGGGGAGSGSTGSSAGGGTWRPPAVWSSAAAPAATSLWPDSSSEHRNATQSSMNSFLPGDLLGGESM